jgi:hypothetical protein
MSVSTSLCRHHHLPAQSLLVVNGKGDDRWRAGRWPVAWLWERKVEDEYAKVEKRLKMESKFVAVHRKAVTD